jgi:hypothetical protein
LLALCASPFWRLHVDRGQIYVLYGGLFLILASIRPAGGGLAFCTSAGSTLLIAMRPVYLAASAIPALWNVRRAVAGLLTGAIAAAGLPLLLCGHAIWFRYLDAMRLHSKLYLEGFQDQPSPTAFPPEIEGIPFDTLRTFARIPFADTSAYRLVSFELEPSWLLASWFLLMIAVLYRNARTLTPAQLWWAVCAWTIIGDFFLPALRNTYNDVAFLPFFLLGLTCLEGTARKVCQGSACVFFASHLATGFLPKAWIPVPSAIGFFIALAATVATVAFPQQLKGSRQGALKD